MKESNLTSKAIQHIRYKIIEHERTEDAPFVGALISACDCEFDCKNCFNQKIKSFTTQYKTCDEIVNEVKSNPFNKGIIFGGLEWTLQIHECIALASTCKKHGLLTMIYTGTSDGNVIKTLELSGAFDYIKYGRYIEELRTANHIEYGVVLASENQHILKKGVDYA